MGKRIIIRSKRLYLREMDQDDLDFLIALHQDPVVMKYIGAPRSTTSITNRLAHIQWYYCDQPGYGIWMICQQTTHDRIGWGCLKDLDGTSEREIGYRLAPQYWGHGYASEVAKALVNYGFRSMRLPKIVGVTHLENVGSMRVLEKAGLHYIDDRYHYHGSVRYYELSRAEWEEEIQAERSLPGA